MAKIVVDLKEEMNSARLLDDILKRCARGSIVLELTPSKAEGTALPKPIDRVEISVLPGNVPDTGYSIRAMVFTSIMNKEPLQGIAVPNPPASDASTLLAAIAKELSEEKSLDIRQLKDRLSIAASGGIVLLQIKESAQLDVEITVKEREGSENLNEDLTNLTTILGSVLTVARKEGSPAAQSDVSSDKEQNLSFRLGTKSILVPASSRSKDRGRAPTSVVNPVQSGITFASIGGCQDAKRELERLAYGLANPKEFEELGLEYPRGIILHGPPGTGKTLLARAMANTAKANVYEIGAEEIKDRWYGESEHKMAELFDAARASAPAIILIDEIDTLMLNRAEAHEATGSIVSIFLSRMDGLKDSEGIIVIGTTNRLSDIDPALRRPGRFDKIIAVPLPDEAARAEIFRIRLQGKKAEGGIDCAVLASQTNGFSGADIKGVIQKALEANLDEKRERERLAATMRDGKGVITVKPVSTQDLLAVIKAQAAAKAPGKDQQRIYS